MYLKIVTETVFLVYLWLSAAFFTKEWLRARAESERWSSAIFGLMMLPLCAALLGSMMIMPFYWHPPYKGGPYEFDFIVVMLGFMAYWFVPIMLMSLGTIQRGRQEILGERNDPNKEITGWLMKLSGVEYYKDPAYKITGWWNRNFGFSWFIRGFWIDNKIEAYDTDGNLLVATCSGTATDLMPWVDRDAVWLAARNGAEAILKEAAKCSPDMEKMSGIIRGYRASEMIDFKIEKVTMKPKSVAILQNA